MLTKVSLIIKTIKNDWELLILMIFTFWLRLVNLGYSDFQGDEIKALLIPDQGQSTIDFLLTQRKGPIQFIVTYLMGFITPDYNNRLIMRLPFALAGSLAVFFFFRFLNIHLKSKKLSFFASFFLATNGFFVAFSRIIQYQSFVILFTILSLYFFSLATIEEKWKIKGLYLGFIFWALSILSHYDGIFIFPFVLYLIYSWSLKYDRRTLKSLGRSLLFPVAIFIILILSFYVPFVLEISKSTLNYWQGRIEGTGDKISSSIYLFRVYQPIYVIYAYFGLGFLGVLKLISIFIGLIKKKDYKDLAFYAAVLLWFIIPFIFLEVFVSIPGTHIYTYLIPCFIVLSLGIYLIEKLVSKVLGKIAFNKLLFWLGVSVVFGFMFVQSHQIFVDHKVEYPWEDEKFFIWTFTKPTPIFHLSIFGFPYYRNWSEIGRIVMESENNGFYSTNERDSISRYHIKLKKNAENAGHYIFIKDPQSFEGKVTDKKVKYWMENYSPITTFFKEGDPVVEIYYMPSGDLSKIKSDGF